MNPTTFIQRLDHQPKSTRLKIIQQTLDTLHTPYQLQPYATGTNLIVNLGDGDKRIAVASHYDVVPGSGGANDNASAITVCIEIIRRYKTTHHPLPPLRIFFFDEEENGLKGSTAYTQTYGIQDLHGLINMELVGMGDQYALWPVNRIMQGPLLLAFEATAKQQGIACNRFDQIITNTADHDAFRKAGLKDAFTVTSISDTDKRIATDYYMALEWGADQDELFEILRKAPIFAHYHRPTDTHHWLDDGTILRTADTIWEAIQTFCARLG
jgi:Zn-dependent M28 family amino/carboxypeptidase